MAEVTITNGAANFRPDHSERSILKSTHPRRIDRVVEARPSAPRVVFCAGVKKLGLASAAAVDPRTLLIEIRTRKGTLRAVLAQDPIFIRRQKRAPLFFRTFNLDRKSTRLNSSHVRIS